MKITDHFRRIYKTYPNLIKENRKTSTCNRLDLQTLRTQPVMPTNLSITGQLGQPAFGQPQNVRSPIRSPRRTPMVGIRRPSILGWLYASTRDLDGA